MNKKLLGYIALIVGVAFTLFITVGIFTGYIRFVSDSKGENELMKAYQSAKTPEEQCKILNQLYGDNVTQCISEKLRLKF